MLINKRIPLSYILLNIKWNILFVLIVSLSVHYLSHKYRFLIPLMPLTIPAFIGTAISVLVSFKLSQSYDRWWEARKIWGSIVNDSRNFVIQIQTLIHIKDESLIKKMAYRQIAWCYVLGNSLRNQDEFQFSENLLTKEDLSAIKSHQNKALAILQLQSLDIKKLNEDGVIDKFSQVQLNNTIINLCNSMGMAERIKTTVFPITYSMFLHLIIYLFVITLSISLDEIEWYFEIPLLMAISFSFLLLEKTANHIQEPFSNNPTDISVTAIARTIEINIKQLLNEEEIPNPIDSNKFYLL